MKHAYTLIPFLVVVRIIEVFSLTAELWQEEYLPLYPETQKTPESHNKFEKSWTWVERFRRQPGSIK